MIEDTKKIGDVKNDEDEKNAKVDQPRKRIPLGTRNILTAPKKSGFVRRFVNDKGDRVQRFKEAGYSIVEENIQVGDPKIGKASQLGGSVDVQVGSGQRAILMEIPEKYYNEDKKIAQDKITKVENEIRRNTKNPGPDGLHGQVQLS